MVLGLTACSDMIVVRDPCTDLRYIETRDAVVRGSPRWDSILAGFRGALDALVAATRAGETDDQLADEKRSAELPVTEYRDWFTIGTAQQSAANNLWIERICRTDEQRTD